MKRISGCSSTIQVSARYRTHPNAALRYSEPTLAISTPIGSRSLLVDNLPPHVFILNARPNLEAVITGIIHDLETGSGLSDDILHENKYAEVNELSSASPRERIHLELKRIRHLFSASQV